MNQKDTKTTDQISPQEIGIQRAKKLVAAAGQKWEEITIIDGPEMYTHFFRKFGLPSAVSEREDALPFGKSGSIFTDDDTGLFVGYAQSNVDRRVSAPSLNF